MNSLSLRVSKGIIAYWTLYISLCVATLFLGRPFLLDTALLVIGVGFFISFPIMLVCFPFIWINHRRYFFSFLGAFLLMAFIAYLSIPQIKGQLTEQSRSSNSLPAVVLGTRLTLG